MRLRHSDGSDRIVKGERQTGPRGFYCQAVAEVKGGLYTIHIGDDAKWSRAYRISVPGSSFKARDGAVLKAYIVSNLDRTRDESALIVERIRQAVSRYYTPVVPDRSSQHCGTVDRLGNQQRRRHLAGRRVLRLVEFLGRSDALSSVHKC